MLKSIFGPVRVTSYPRESLQVAGAECEQLQVFWRKEKSTSYSDTPRKEAYKSDCDRNEGSASQ